MWLKQEFARGNIRCAWCGKVLSADGKDVHVDHKVPHHGDDQLKYDESNLQAMHASCHSKKTVACDGGFGRSAT